MKNIGASVDAVLTQEEEEEEEEKVEEIEEEVEEEEYTEKKNEMVFYLRENPKCQVYAVGKWYENSHGQVIGDVDTYFLHILTNQRCESVWDCFSEWSEQDKNSAEKWETLCRRIEDLPSIEAFICDEKRVEL